MMSMTLSIHLLLRRFDVDIAAAAIIMGLSVLPTPHVIRVAAGIVSILFVPGYAVMLAVFPRRTQLREIERWGLSVIISTCIEIFLPYAMSQIGWGISGLHYSMTMVVVMLVLLTSAVVRRHGIPQEERYLPTFLVQTPAIFTLCCVIGISVLVTWVVRSTSTSPITFFVTNEQGSFEHNPYHVAQGSVQYVRLHIANPTLANLSGFIVMRDQRGILNQRRVYVSGHSKAVVTIRLPSDHATTERVNFTFQDQREGDKRTLWLTYQVVSHS